MPLKLSDKQVKIADSAAQCSFPSAITDAYLYAFESVEQYNRFTVYSIVPSWVAVQGFTYYTYPFYCAAVPNITSINDQF